MGISSSAEISMARRTSSASRRGTPSSVNPTAPAAASCFISVSCFPCMPMVTLAQVVTWIPVFAPLSRIYFRVSSLSTVGFVFAISTTVVTPPFAAAAAPVLISSFAVKPGSLKCTCTSTSPGATNSPSALILVTLPFGSIFSAIFTILSPSIRISKLPSFPDLGSII